MLFIIRGVSCSGKSTLVKKYFEPAHVLASDTFRELLCGNVYDQVRNSLIFDKLREFLDYRFSFGVKYTVIDATNLRVRDIQGYIDLAEIYKVPVTIITLDPPELEVLYDRSQKRYKEGGLLVPNEAIKNQYERYFNNMDQFTNKEMTLGYKLVRINQEHEVVR